MNLEITNMSDISVREQFAVRLGSPKLTGIQLAYNAVMMTFDRSGYVTALVVPFGSIVRPTPREIYDQGSEYIIEAAEEQVYAYFYDHEDAKYTLFFYTTDVDHKNESKVWEYDFNPADAPPGQ